MNKHDAQNLEFLMAISPEALFAWFASASADDVEYARWLLAEAGKEAEGIEFNYPEPIVYEEITDLSVAKKYLSTFTLGGIK